MIVPVSKSELNTILQCQPMYIYCIYKNGVAGKKVVIQYFFQPWLQNFFSQKNFPQQSDKCNPSCQLEGKRYLLMTNVDKRTGNGPQIYGPRTSLLSFLTFFCYLSHYTLKSLDSKCAKIYNLYLVIHVKTKSILLISLRDLKKSSRFLSLHLS